MTITTVSNSQRSLSEDLHVKILFSRQGWDGKLYAIVESLFGWSVRKQSQHLRSTSFNDRKRLGTMGGYAFGSEQKYTGISRTNQFQ